jgi:nitrite reductase/ring-hydroxylating ferredoxin subunit
MNVDRQTLQVDPSLELALTYNREIRAGIERIWENVFDWEHLPVLHASQFNHVALVDIGSWGWRVRLTKRPGSADRRMLLKLHTDRPNGRYRVRILAGDGTGTEIWTLMECLGPDRTAVEVRYYLPERRPERLKALGQAYRLSCARLWDEDEAMMMRRAALTAHAAAGRRRSEAPLSLGPLPELWRRLPLLVEFDGEPFRIIEIDGGTLLAHATTCPHWLGPLDEVIPQNGILRCPWHGYLFDIRTGGSADGRGYRLAPAPQVVIDPVSGDVTLTRGPARASEATLALAAGRRCGRRQRPAKIRQ